MKVAVFGWYGHDNAGDERIKYCLNKFLIEIGGIRNIDFFDLHTYAIKGKTNQFDHYDLVIVGGGGLIISNHNYHDFILNIKTKLITVGVSVETELKDNPKKFVLALIKKSSFFFVRDRGSYEQLKDIDNKVKKSSDLTFLVPYEVTSNSEEDTIGLNLFAKANCSPIIFKILCCVARFAPQFTPQVIDFSLLIKDLEKIAKVMPIPLYSIPQQLNIPEYQMNDVNYLRKYFRNVPDYFHHADIDKCKLFISMRLHGLIFAIQKCIPVITFSTYPKQINLMKELGMENCLLYFDCLEDSKSVIEYVVKNMSCVKEKIMSYRNKSINDIRQSLTEAIEKTIL